MKKQYTAKSWIRIIATYFKRGTMNEAVFYIRKKLAIARLRIKITTIFADSTMNLLKCDHNADLKNGIECLHKIT